MKCANFFKDDDELGFRKNDIITIVSQRDEHCWVGELNGHTGWFPAKLVRASNPCPKPKCYFTYFEFYVYLMVACCN